MEEANPRVTKHDVEVHVPNILVATLLLSSVYSLEYFLRRNTFFFRMDIIRDLYKNINLVEPTN